MMRVMRRALRASYVALELSGAAAFVYGVELVSVPAAFMVGGVLACLLALALERTFG